MIEINSLLKKYSDSTIELKKAYEEVINYKKLENTPDYDLSILFLLAGKFKNKKREFAIIDKTYKQYIKDNNLQ